MSRQITQPVNQVRLTNVAVVRINRHGKRFEVACYRNKIVNYRQGLETDLDEVLQTEKVFTNVSKGQFAKSSDLRKAFGTTDETEVCRFILDKGDYQISDLERLTSYQDKFREIATLIQEKCVNPSINRRYTITVIMEAMKKSEFSVHPTKSAKQQFLDCVKLIKFKEVLPLERAKMLVCISYKGDESSAQKVMTQLKEEPGADVTKHDDDAKRIEILIDPGLYRKVDGIVKENPGMLLEILQQCVTEEGEVGLEQELYRREEKRIADAEAVHKDRGDAEEGTTSPLPSSIEQGVEEAMTTDLSHLNISPLEKEPPSMTTQKAAIKKAKKKSKKEKRREKADAMERQERIEVEKARQEEREKRLAAKKSASEEQEHQPTTSDSSRKSKSCNTCGGSFTLEEHRRHFQSDWHRYNLKLKMQGIPIVSEEEFKICDADAFFVDNL